MISVEFLDRLLNLLTIKLVMTPRNEFVTCEDDEPITLLKKKLEKFDLLPVSSERIQYFVSKSNVERLFEENRLIKVIEVKQPIYENNPIPEDEPIHKYLLLRGEPVFVTKQNEVVGIVTHADLNKIPSKMMFFILISYFELLLIQSTKNLGLTDKQIEGCIGFQRWWQAQGRNELAKRENSQLSLIECLDTGALIDLACKIPTIRTRLNYQSEQRARKSLKPIEYLRNKIMHSGHFIVQNKEQLIQRRTEYKRTMQHIIDLISDSNAS